MRRPLRVVQYGLGPIGLQITRFLQVRGGFEIVGAIDIAPEKLGRDLGELAGLARPLDVKVSSDIDGTLRAGHPDVVILTTTSSLERLRPQVLGLLAYEVNIVSTCEELAYPWITHPDIAGEIDRAARERGVAVLSTGVNPGFLMDYLPLVLSGVALHVDRIRVERVQDARYRRLPFQKKIGAGLSLDEFQAEVRRGTLRHVGLTESMHLISSRLNWALERTEETIEPIMAEERIVTPHLTVELGQVRGVRQMGYGYIAGDPVITLAFLAAVGEPTSYERTVLEGEPPIDMTIAGGINGDIATGAIVINALPVIVAARPGLRTMADMELITCYR